MSQIYFIALCPVRLGTCDFDKHCLTLSPAIPSIVTITFSFNLFLLFLLFYLRHFDSLITSFKIRLQQIQSGEVKTTIGVDVRGTGRKVESANGP